MIGCQLPPHVKSGRRLGESDSSGATAMSCTSAPARCCSAARQACSSAACSSSASSTQVATGDAWSAVKLAGVPGVELNESASVGDSQPARTTRCSFKWPEGHRHARTSRREKSVMSKLLAIWRRWPVTRVGARANIVETEDTIEPAQTTTSQPQTTLIDSLSLSLSLYLTHSLK